MWELQKFINIPVNWNDLPVNLLFVRAEIFFLFCHCSITHELEVIVASFQKFLVRGRCRFVGDKKSHSGCKSRKSSLQQSSMFFPSVSRFLFLSTSCIFANAGNSTISARKAAFFPYKTVNFLCKHHPVVRGILMNTQLWALSLLQSFLHATEHNKDLKLLTVMIIHNVDFWNLHMMTG